MLKKQPQTVENNRYNYSNYSNNIHRSIKGNFKNKEEQKQNSSITKIPKILKSRKVLLEDGLGKKIMLLHIDL